MKSATILMVDDSERDRCALRRQLQSDSQCDYRLLEASLPATGLDHFREDPPDCVLLDDALPAGGSLDFLDGIRNPDGQLPVPVVVLTASGHEKAAAALLEAGANDYLIKDGASAEAARLAISSAIFKFRAAANATVQKLEFDQACAEARRKTEELERAHSAKDRFLAMLSHELRTPLAPVLSAVSAALGESCLDADLRETFEIIQRNIQTEARLIDDLLDLAQVLEGSLAIERAPLSVNACIRAAMSLTKEAFAQNSVTLIADLQAERAIVHGDSGRLQQLLWILLKNAANFTAAGGKVELLARQENEEIVIEIHDSGAGIPANRLDSVFDAFGASASEHRFGSVGIGLTLARGIAKAHQGDLTAQSDGPGKGAVFTVRLPLSANPSSRAEESSPSRKRMHILVVEDHLDTCKVLGRALRHKGFDVDLAGTAASARRLFSENPPDLLICDLGLPDGTGWDLLRQLREIRPIPAIAMSGYGLESDLARSREAGFATHMTKPVNFNRLEQVIAQVVQENS